MKHIIILLVFFGLMHQSFSQSLDVGLETRSLQDLTYMLDYKTPVTEKSYNSLYTQYNTGSDIQGAYLSIQSYHNIKLNKNLIISAGYERLYFVDSKISYNLANIKLRLKIF